MNKKLIYFPNTFHFGWYSYISTFLNFLLFYTKVEHIYFRIMQNTIFIIFTLLFYATTTTTVIRITTINSHSVFEKKKIYIIHVKKYRLMEYSLLYSNVTNEARLLESLFP
jgi:hypothetical protein